MHIDRETDILMSDKNEQKFQLLKNKIKDPEEEIEPYKLTNRSIVEKQTESLKRPGKVLHPTDGIGIEP